MTDTSPPAIITTVMQHHYFSNISGIPPIGHKVADTYFNHYFAHCRKLKSHHLMCSMINFTFFYNKMEVNEAQHNCGELDSSRTRQENTQLLTFSKPS